MHQRLANQGKPALTAALRTGRGCNVHNLTLVKKNDRDALLNAAKLCFVPAMWQGHPTRTSEAGWAVCWHPGGRTCVQPSATLAAGMQCMAAEAVQ
jgi:hypothetical protein